VLMSDRNANQHEVRRKRARLNRTSKGKEDFLEREGVGKERISAIFPTLEKFLVRKDRERPSRIAIKSRTVTLNSQQGEKEPLEIPYEGESCRGDCKGTNVASTA